MVLALLGDYFNCWYPFSSLFRVPIIERCEGFASTAWPAENAAHIGSGIALLHAIFFFIYPCRARHGQMFETKQGTTGTGSRSTCGALFSFTSESCIFLTSDKRDFIYERELYFSFER